MYLTQGLHRAAQATPSLAATIADERVRTWAECIDRVSRLAGALIDLGVRRGDRVAILALNSDFYHEALLAISWADAVFNPVNTRWSVAEIAFSLSDCDCRMLLVDDQHASLVTQLRERAPGVHTVLHAGVGPTPDGALSTEALIADHAPVPDARRAGNDMAGIFYTGGTTGDPKGVMLSHANLHTCATGCAATGSILIPGGRSLLVGPMFHVAAFLQWTTRNVLGGTHVILPSFDPKAVSNAIERYRATDVLLVPTMIQMLLDSPETAQADLSSLRLLLYGASPISESVLERAMKRLPTTGFTQAYGMTELSPATTLLTPDDHRRPDLRRSAGRPAPHSEVRILDQSNIELPRGTIGEICSRGGHVMLGYWNRPDETETTLRDGWLHSGDGGYMDDRGYIYVVDRFKDMIVSGGENVYSVEVENALAKHPAVAACAVIGLPDPDWGERVHAVIVPASDDRPDVDSIRAYVKTYIAGYKAPRTVEYVDRLPLSGPGKVLKRELRSKYWKDQDRGVS